MSYFTYDTSVIISRKDNSLIVPDQNDWLLTSRILFWLTQGRRRTAKGKLKKMPVAATQRMALDVLIAVSARRWRATVVTRTTMTSRRFSGTAIQSSRRLQTSLADKAIWVTWSQNRFYFPNLESLNVTSAPAQAFLNLASTRAASSAFPCAFSACVSP